MAENDRPEIHVTLFKDRPDETKLRLFLPGDGWTFEEAKVAKNVSEGMSMGQIENGLQEGDPDAWLAVLRVSYMRAGEDFPARLIMGENAMGLIEELSRETSEALRRRPPTSPNGSGSAELPEIETIASPAAQS